jgi:hypothetical protein
LVVFASSWVQVAHLPAANCTRFASRATQGASVRSSEAYAMVTQTLVSACIVLAFVDAGNNADNMVTPKKVLMTPSLHPKGNSIRLDLRPAGRCETRTSPSATVIHTGNELTFFAQSNHA